MKRQKAPEFEILQTSKKKKLEILKRVSLYAMIVFVCHDRMSIFLSDEGNTSRCRVRPAAQHVVSREQQF
jgi:hypothetical protein